MLEKSMFGNENIKKDQEMINEQKKVYKESKKAYLDMQRNPLSKEDRSSILILNALQGAMQAQNFLEQHGVDIKELDAELEKELSQDQD